MKRAYFTTATAILSAIIFFSCSKGDKQVITTYSDGKPKLVFYTKNQNDKKVLVYQKMFYQNGKLRFEGEVKNNQKYGIWKYYFETGQLFAKTDFTLNPAGELWEVFTADKKPLITTSDTLITAALTKDNELVGINVRRQGLEKIYRFFESFNLQEERTLKGNILNGQSTAYFENGNIQSVHYYKDGFNDSTFSVFNENGTKLYNGQYKMGVKVGKWDFYNSDGSVRSEMYDTNGNKIRQ
ncbi:MAG: hypothetical protein LBR17_09405 [Bacteroidales bacterium]|jgi:antitoxin component YwqK of YwqJK toxin-antitoxin module|nr:hypothetical protein [Bacteroidales bacterium]